jgi:hypothetical protein
VHVIKALADMALAIDVRLAEEGEGGGPPSRRA